MIKDTSLAGTDAFGVDRVRFLDSGALIRVAQSRPLSAAILSGSLALHVFALLLLNWLEQAPQAKPDTTLEIPVELVAADPGKGTGQNAAKPTAPPKAEANTKPQSRTSSQSAQPRSAAAAQPEPKSQPPKPAAQQPEQPKVAAQPPKPAAPEQPKSQAKAEAPKPAVQPPPQPAASTQPPKPPALSPPPAAAQSNGVPAMASLQMQAMHPSAALLPFSMDQNYQAVAVPSPSENGDLAVAYKTLVFSLLELAKQFPEDARARGAHGTATVYFEIDDNGGVKTVKLLQSSGDTELDVESLAVVERASPFPKPPRGAQKIFAAEIEFDPAER